MKINFLQLAALACLGTQALATPIAEPAATNTLHERSWDPVAWWNLWWKWFHQHMGNGGGKACRNPLVRKEWYVLTSGANVSAREIDMRCNRRQLTTTQKNKYISAVQCLAERPAITTSIITGALSRYDDFQGVHSRQTPNIHWVTVHLTDFPAKTP
jgi:hypothetical protein